MDPIVVYTQAKITDEITNRILDRLKTGFNLQDQLPKSLGPEKYCILVHQRDIIKFILKSSANLTCAFSLVNYGNIALCFARLNWQITFIWMCFSITTTHWIILLCTCKITSCCRSYERWTDNVYIYSSTWNVKLLSRAGIAAFRKSISSIMS